MRILKLFIFLLAISPLRSQTLYWVGGSGNFNDANHWSLSPHGPSANTTPNSNTDLVFDNTSGTGNLVVSLVGTNYARSIIFNNDFLPIAFTGNSHTELHIGGDFQMNSQTFFTTNSKLFFNSGSAQYHDIRFHQNAYAGDVEFQSGNWNLKYVNIAKSNTVKFLSGNYRLQGGHLRAGNLVADAGQVNFQVDGGMMVVESLFNLGINTTFSSDKLYLSARQTDPSKFLVPPDYNFGTNAKILNQAALMSCSVGLISKSVSCSGICDGKLIVTIDPSCSNPPFTLSWSNNSCPLPTLTSVPAAGTYTISNLCQCSDPWSLIVFDNNANIVDIPNPVPINAPGSINFVPFSPVQPLCNGQCNGSFIANLSGGTGPYTVTLNGMQVGTATFAVSNGNTTYTNMCGGITHTAVILDFNGCTRTVTTVLPNQPAVLAPGFAVSNVACFGQCTGSAVVAPTGGTAGYTVNLSPGGIFTIPGGGSTSTTGICANVAISTTVTDTKGCTVTAGPITVTQPATVNIVQTQTNVSCFGLCNGAASLQVSGGVSPYTFSWSVVGNTNSISGQCAGVKTVTVTNNGGQCTNTLSFNITQPASVTLNATVTNVTCAGLCNGSATMSPTGGAGGYQYTWTPAPGGGQGTATISGLCAGSYTATVLDIAGCTNTAVLTVTAPPAYTVTAATQTIACFGQCTGAASLSVSGNNAPYTYVWSPNPPIGQGTGTISSLCAGNYTVNITSAAPASCPTTAVVNIPQPSSITPNVSSASITCNGACNGSINAAPTGGNGAPYTYSLITPLGATITSSPPYTNLCQGLYTLIVADNGSCPQTFTINILQPNPLIPSINVTSVTCFNACNGSLGSGIIGGSPGYTLAWNTPTGSATGAGLSNQCAGNYTLTVTDSHGCTASTTAAVNQPSQIQSTLNVTNPLCNGFCNGNINANVAGGTPSYTLTWSNAFTGNPNTNLCAGNYTLTVTDAQGCQRSFTTALTNPPAITSTITTINPVCTGSCNASATVVASGGVGPYTYQFNTIPVTTNTTGIVTNLCPGNYVVSITDAQGCNVSANFSIVNPPVLSINVNSLQTTCNLCTGGGTITVSGGTPTYNVVWTNSLNATVGNGTAVNGLCPGPYTITATDAANCTASVAVNILQTVSVTVIVAGSGIQCHNACTGSAVATATGGQAPYSFTWTPSGQNTATATSLCPGIYTVQVADQNTCTSSATLNMVNPPDITVTVTQTNVLCNGSCNGVLSANASGGTGPLSYSWSPGGQTTSSITGLCGGSNYTLTVSDGNNCSKTQTFSITQNPSITVTFTASNPTSCANNNGSICVSATGGSGGPFTYTWTPGAMTTSCVSNLGAGIYTVVIADGSCTMSAVISLVNPSGPTVNVSTSSVTCFSGNTGGATVTVVGTPTFGFAWTGGVSFTNAATSSTASGLITGTYNISVTDGNNCVTSQTFAIAQAPSLTVNSTITNQKCNPPSPCNGSITISPSGATPNYTIAYSGGPTGTTAAGGTVAYTGLCNGNYTATITDANGCAQTRTFALVAPPAITVNAITANVQCFGMCNGSIAANAVGGTSPLSYTWLPVGVFPGAITGTIINLCANNYTLNVNDGNGCTKTQTFAITQPTSALTSTLTNINSSCSNSCNATATIVGAGGTPTYSFSWTGLPITTSTAGNLCAGNYTATVTDANGCTSSQPFTVTAPAPITATLLPSSPLCNNSCNASISTTLNGNQGALSYTWLPTGSGANPSALCPGNYTMIAVDANSCQITAVTTVTNPPALLANVTTTNPSCNASCNGAAISSPANAQGTVSYVWTPAAPNSATNSPLCDGNYTLIITDQNSCTATAPFTLTSPPSLSVNPSVAPATCGQSNGSISVVVAGGTPTYNFVWSPVGSGSVTTGLGVNVYSITVTDQNGCTSSVSVPLGNANGPSVTPVSSTSVNCFGQSTGAASVITGSIQGGTPGYTVSWLSPPAPSTVNPLSGLPAGTYTAQVTDANSCVAFTAVTISQPASITINPNFTLATCNGNCNGIIVLNASGGTPGYQYTWTPLGPNNSATLTSACAGTYTINILDNQNCPSTQTVNLPATVNMAATTSVTANPCSNSCIATASLTSIGGGLPPYVISWSNGQFGSTANNLCSGIYSVMVTDANNCFNTFTTNITSPSAITATSAIAAPGCSLCNGSSTINASGGTAPFTYSWTSGATGTVAGNLCAGLYQVLITDNNGCTITQNVAVSSSVGITGETFTVQNETCANSCNGSVAVSPVGGAAPITYSWIAPPANTSTLNNLCAGVYFVQMTDNNGCIRTASTTVGSVSAMTISPFVIQPSCGSSNGTISINISGGTPSYSINWSAPIVSTATTVTGLGAGIYSVTVTDAGGCSQTQAFNLSNSTAPVITYTQSNITCFGLCTGSIIAAGISTDTPLTYNWSNGNTTPTVTGLCTGVVSLTISSNSGCKAIQTFTLTQNPSMQLSISNITQPKCFNDCNGDITLVPSGGTLPYTFTWTPIAVTGNPQFSLCPGNYTATVIDARGCFTTTTANLINPPQFTVSNTFTNSSCSTSSDGIAIETAAGGTGTLSYSWSGPNSFSASTSSISGVTSGNYTVLVTDARGCTATDSVKIVPTITLVANAGSNPTVCLNGSVTLDGSPSTGSIAGYSWIQLPNNTSTIATTPSVIVSPGVGTTSYVLQVISTGSACIDTQMVLVNVYPLPQVSAGTSTTIPLFTSIMIGGSPTSPTGISFSWTPAFTLDNPVNPNPTASNTINTTYTVFVTDANGCTASDTIRVDIYPEIKIPNGFSPNGDGKNDMWVIDNIDQFPDCVVEVYNRWGERLYYAPKGYSPLFNGKYKGSDLPVGTYYYIINLNHPAYPKAYTGPLTIFR